MRLHDQRARVHADPDARPPLDFIEYAAEALEVSVAELLGSQPHVTLVKPGLTSQLQRRIEQVKLLSSK